MAIGPFGASSSASAGAGTKDGDDNARSNLTTATTTSMTSLPPTSPFQPAQAAAAPEVETEVEAEPSPPSLKKAKQKCNAANHVFGMAVQSRDSTLRHFHEAIEETIRLQDLYIQSQASVQQAEDKCKLAVAEWQICRDLFAQSEEKELFESASQIGQTCTSHTELSDFLKGLRKASHKLAIVPLPSPQPESHPFAAPANSPFKVAMQKAMPMKGQSDAVVIKSEVIVCRDKSAIDLTGEPEPMEAEPMEDLTKGKRPVESTLETNNSGTLNPSTLKEAQSESKIVAKGAEQLAYQAREAPPVNPLSPEPACYTHNSQLKPNDGMVSPAFQAPESQQLQGSQPVAFTVASLTEPALAAPSATMPEPALAAPSATVPEPALAAPLNPSSTEPSDRPSLPDELRDPPRDIRSEDEEL